MIHAKVGLQRIQKFMDADEMVGRDAPSANPFDAAPSSSSVLPTSQPAHGNSVSGMGLNGIGGHKGMNGVHGGMGVGGGEEEADDLPLLSKRVNGVGSSDGRTPEGDVCISMPGSTASAVGLEKQMGNGKKRVTMTPEGYEVCEPAGEGEGGEEEAEWWDGETGYWDTVVRVERGTFAWDKPGKSGAAAAPGSSSGPKAGKSEKGAQKSEKAAAGKSDPVLHDIELEVQRGQLVMIVGEVRHTPSHCTALPCAALYCTAPSSAQDGHAAAVHVAGCGTWMRYVHCACLPCSTQPAPTWGDTCCRCCTALHGVLLTCFILPPCLAHSYGPYCHDSIPLCAAPYCLVPHRTFPGRLWQVVPAGCCAG